MENVGISDKSIDEGCKPTVKFDMTNNRKRMDDHTYKCTTYLKKNCDHWKKREGENHSLDSYPSESGSGKREDTFNNRDRNKLRI